MKSKFSIGWKSSRKTSKQRKYRLNAPLHIKQKFVHSHLSKDLRKKYGKRSATARKGDRVKILNGRFKKHEGKIERVDIKKSLVFISGTEITKKDGTKRILPSHPSNLIITELNMDDKKRQQALERK